MKYSKLIAAILAVLALSACIGGAVIVPIPIAGSADRENERDAPR